MIRLAHIAGASLNVAAWQTAVILYCRGLGVRARYSWILGLAVGCVMAFATYVLIRL